MKCAHCNVLNPLVAYANTDCLIFFCHQLCLEGFEHAKTKETPRLAETERPKAPYFREDRGSLGENAELHDLQQSGTQRSLWQPRRWLDVQ